MSAIASSSSAAEVKIPIAVIEASVTRMREVSQGHTTALESLVGVIEEAKFKAMNPPPEGNGGPKSLDDEGWLVEEEKTRDFNYLLGCDPEIFYGLFPFSEF